MNILVIRFSSLGDLVTLSRTFRAIRYFFKDDNIDFLTSGIGKALYEDSDYFDNYYLHDTVYKSISELRSKEYDLVINLQCNKPSHYVSLFLKKKKLVNKSHSLYHKLFGLKGKNKNYKKVLESTGFVKKEQLDEYLKNYSQNFELTYKDLGLLNEYQDKKTIVISTGTSERWTSKKWGIERYSILVENLIEKGYQVVLIGTKLEIFDAQQILEKFPQVVDYVNKTSLNQLKSLLAEADLFIGNDSGPAHIAAAVGTSTITIFGSTNPHHSPAQMPYNGEHTYLAPTSKVECHPCYKTQCPTKMECMQSITVDEVMKKVKLILK